MPAVGISFIAAFTLSDHAQGLAIELPADQGRASGLQVPGQVVADDEVRAVDRDVRGQVGIAVVT